MTQDNPVGWFEIPVTNMDRAIKFYEEVFNVKLDRHEMGETHMAWFPMKLNGSGSAGTLIEHKKFYKPSQEGTLVYFTAKSGDVATEAAAAVKAGGSIVVEKKNIGEHGFIAIVKDSEGNRIGLHSMK